MPIIIKMKTASLLLLLLLLQHHIPETTCFSLDLSKNRDTRPAADFRAAVYQCRKPPPTTTTTTITSTTTSTTNATAAASSPSLLLYNLRRVTDALQRAANHNVELVIFPEGFLCDDDEAALDREASELNVIGQLAQAFEVACVVPFAEKRPAATLSKLSSSPSPIVSSSLSSVAIFHWDGSRAGTYTSIASSNGNPFVESLPIRIRLKSCSQVGLTCGILTLEDLWTSPEHGRHVVRLGAQLLLVVAGAERRRHNDERLLRHVLPTRAMENQVPILCANLEGPAKTTTHPLPQIIQQDDDNNNDADDVTNNNKGKQCVSSSFVGLSGIISTDGEELIRAPVYDDDDDDDANIPNEEDDAGRVVVGVKGSSIIPCNGGELYVSTVTIAHNHEEEGSLLASSLSSGLSPSSSCIIQQSKSRWDIVPRNNNNNNLNDNNGMNSSSTSASSSSSDRTTPNDDAHDDDAHDDINDEDQKKASNKGFGASKMIRQTRKVKKNKTKTR
jgi:predicted amidohydrolase